MNGRKAGTLVVGLLLILTGLLFLLSNLISFQVDWVLVLKITVPVLCVAAGLVKLGRHYTAPVEAPPQGRRRSSLLSGLFWLTLGLVVFFDILGVLNSLEFIGTYWPVLLIGFGLAKIADHYRVPGGVQVRMGEIFGVIFILVFGLACNRLAKAHLPLIDDFTWGDFRVSLPTALEGERFRFESTQPLQLEGIESIQIENLYGDVVLEPADPAAASLRLVTEVRAKSRQRAEELNREVALRLNPSDGRLTVATNRADLGEKGRGIGTTMFLQLPATTPATISNGFGAVRVSRYQAPVSITNSYGDVQVSSQNGPLTVTNRNGRVEVRSVAGSVKIVNQRAAILVDNVDGSVEAATEYDSIRLEHVRGDVVVRNHFGSVRLVDIQGEASVVGEGSSVHAEHLSQGLTVKNSHKEVRIRDIAGPVDLETSYSRVELTQIMGGVSLKAVHSTVNAKELRQEVTIAGKGSEIGLTGIAGPLRVETSLRKVKVEDFSGPVTIQNEFGEVVLENRNTPTQPMRIINKNGSILLSLPARSHFRLAAQAVGGEIESDFGSMAEAAEPAPGGVAVFETTVGAGGPLIELQTSHSRIRIKKRG
jgi:DUF4097 and DUF4098 domain-containing protein YvlB